MLVCGQPPFQEANDSETLTMIMDCKYTVPTHVSNACKEWVPQTHTQTCTRILINKCSPEQMLTSVFQPWLCNRWAVNIWIGARPLTTTSLLCVKPERLSGRQSTLCGLEGCQSDLCTSNHWQFFRHFSELPESGWSWQINMSAAIPIALDWPRGWCLSL